MASWPVYLHSKFAEAVELLKRSPKFTLMMVDVEEEITIDYKNNFTDANRRVRRIAALVPFAVAISEPVAYLGGDVFQGWLAIPPLMLTNVRTVEGSCNFKGHAIRILPRGTMIISR